MEIRIKTGIFTVTDLDIEKNKPKQNFGQGSGMTPMRVSKHLDLYGVKRDQGERNRKITGICFFRQRLK
jgi:hypothetical protein